MATTLASFALHEASAVLHAIWNIKARLLRHGGVANPRDTLGIAVVCALP
ncbi:MULTISPECIES: hypothetical protein [unclassified Polaromonas]|nr:MULTISPECIES: hypothetical protein [unclassified Polaromonas]HQR97400.1 hypothetical protein [Polaromonas sp.]HQS41474.1 hypothetical protein [Polaromonas sp.]HQS88446.1 hypothetical protein [Polaromonas sp.]HQT07833.1 hypothetical protein [Polaromonas sp.]